MKLSTPKMQFLLARNSMVITRLEELAYIFKEKKDFKKLGKVKKEIATLALVQRELKMVLRHEESPKKFKFTIPTSVIGDEDGVLYNAKLMVNGDYGITFVGISRPVIVAKDTVRHMVDTGYWKVK